MRHIYSLIFSVQLSNTGNPKKKKAWQPWTLTLLGGAISAIRLIQGTGPIVVELDPQNLFARLIFDDNVPRISPLAVKILEAPELIRRPTLVGAFDIRLDGLTPIEQSWLPSFFHPLAVLVIGGFGQFDLASAALDLAKDNILVVTPLPVECAFLASSLKAGGDDLVDVNMFGAFIVLVVLVVECNCREADSLPDKPADALQR